MAKYREKNCCIGRIDTLYEPPCYRIEQWQTPYAWGITCSQRQHMQRYRRQLGLFAAPGPVKNIACRSQKYGVLLRRSVGPSLVQNFYTTTASRSNELENKVEAFAWLDMVCGSLFAFISVFAAILNSQNGI